MADAITIQELIDARTDAKTLEQAVNGDAVTTVLSRLGETYPSLSNALNQIDSKLDSADTQIKQAITDLFQNGGLPATPFATKALMTASALIDGQYAMVTDDTVNNGLYVKTAGAWVKSGYDPFLMAKNYINTLPAIFTGSWQQINFEIINGSIINETVTSPLLTALTGGQYIKMDVQNVTQLRIRGSRGESSWSLHFTDANGVRLPKAGYGNGTFAVPTGAIYAYRTFISSKQELYFMYVEGYTSGISKADINASNITASDNKFSDFIDTTTTDVESQVMPIEPIANYFIIKDEGANSVASYREGASFLLYDVEGVDTVTIANGLPSNSTFPWVFLAADRSLIQITDYNTNGTFSIPEGVKYIAKTYNIATVSEPDTLSITFKYKKIPRVKDVVSAVINDVLSPEINNQIKKMVEKLETAWAAGDVLKISSFVGATQHEQIDNALDFIKHRGWGILDMESGVWLRNSAMLLPSNCWIYLNNAEIKLADGVFDNIMRNDGIVPNPDPFEYALELNENSNIRVFGAGNTDAFVSGPSAPYTAPHPISGGDPIPWTGDFYGWRTIGILLANVKSYKLHDFGMRSTVCWAISQEHGCDDFEVYNLDFYTAVKNGDGVNVRLGCKNGKIYNITGRTADDTVALTAYGNLITQHPSGNYIYPIQVGGYVDIGFGTAITDVSVSNVVASGQQNGVRLLCSSGSEMHRITINKVEDTVGSSWVNAIVVSTASGFNADYGQMTNISVNDITSNYAGRALRIAAKLEDSTFNDIKQANATGDIYENVHPLTNSPITNARYI